MISKLDRARWSFLVFWGRNLERAGQNAFFRYDTSDSAFFRRLSYAFDESQYGLGMCLFGLVLVAGICVLATIPGWNHLPIPVAIGGALLFVGHLIRIAMIVAALWMLRIRWPDRDADWPRLRRMYVRIRWQFTRLMLILCVPCVLFAWYKSYHP
jgi:hypothetical protein